MRVVLTPKKSQVIVEKIGAILRKYLPIAWAIWVTYMLLK